MTPSSTHTSSHTSTPHHTYHTSETTQTPENIALVIEQAVTNHTDKILVASKPRKAVYIPTNWSNTIESISDAIAKVDTCPSNIKKEAEKIFKTFLESMGTLLSSISNNLEHDGS